VQRVPPWTPKVSAEKVSAEVEYASVQRFESPQTGHEHYLRHGGIVAERAVSLPETHVRFVPTGGARLYDAVRLLLRLLVRALYFSPILLVPKVALFAMDSWYSDIITLAFVLLVVALFAMASLLVLLHLVVGPRSVRRKKSRIAFAPPRADLLLPESARLSVTGRIDAGAGALPGEMVLFERWEEEAGKLTRTLWMKRFAVVSDDQPPVIVDIEAAPAVYAPYRPDPGEAPPPAIAKALRALGLDAFEQAAPSCTLRHGDIVELAASDTASIPDVDEVPLGNRQLRLATDEGGPYRGGESVPGTLAKSTLADPIVLRVKASN